MTTEHAPEPWQAGTDGYSILDADGCVVMRVSRLIPPQEAARLVRLGTTSPDLLDDLERFIHMAECNAVPGPNTIAQAKAHIAKARGKE